MATMSRFIDYESVKKEMDALREGAQKDGNRHLADAVFFVERLIESRHTRDHDDTKIIPAEMMRDYYANLTGGQIAERWNVPIPTVTKVLKERGIEWKHPENRRA